MVNHVGYVSLLSQSWKKWGYDMPKTAKETISLVAPGQLVAAAEIVAQEFSVDTSQVIAGWLVDGAEKSVIELLQRGKISKGYAVEALDTAYFRLDELLQARSIRLGLTEAQIEESQDTAKALGLVE